VENVFPFEEPEIGEDLDLLPLAARRALDHAGLRLSLDGWRSLPIGDRRSLTRAGTEEPIDTLTVEAIGMRARPHATPMSPISDPPANRLPELVPIDIATWSLLPGLTRFALVHAARRAEKRRDPAILRAALEELVPGASAHVPSMDPASLSSHLGPSGDVRMVDVGEKTPSARRAIAVAHVRMRPETAKRLARGDTPKGEVLATARIAGIMAAKRTPELVPMCHAIALTHVSIAIDVDEEAALVTLRATAEAVDRTGVEMEAMVAASIAAITIYDMLKGIDREMVIEDVMLMEKSGGRSGHFQRTP